MGDNGQFEMFLRASNGRLEIRSSAGNIIAKTATGAEFVGGSGFTDRELCDELRCEDRPGVG